MGRAVLRGRIALRPYTVDPHNIFAFHRTDAYRVRPSFCASPVRLFQSTERLYGRNAMRPPLGSLVASTGRPPLQPNSLRTDAT